jgi:FKBP-type peptidyl-prolyl cis-trans isomerase FklB
VGGILDRIPPDEARLPSSSRECDNTYMQKSFTTAVSVLAVGLMLPGSVLAQQTPPTTNTQQTAPAKAPHSPAGKSRPTGTAKAQAPLTLKTQKEKISYAIGMNIGTGMHRQSLQIDPNILLRGLKDSLAGGKTLMTDEEAKAVMTQLQNEMRKAQQEKMQQAGAANKKEGDAFLEANKTKEGVKVLPSGLQYKILKEGTGPKPTESDTVVCNYRGTLIDGKEFDSSYKRGEPATFPVNGVIKGWTEALQLMPVGSKWQLFLPADLAYGDRGAGADIGPDATLIFEVELMSIQQAKPADASPDKK